jgi:hypothetical protein
MITSSMGEAPAQAASRMEELGEEEARMKEVNVINHPGRAAMMF